MGASEASDVGLGDILGGRGLLGEIRACLNANFRQGRAGLMARKVFAETAAP
jgi:hypothetical protein